MNAMVRRDYWPTQEWKSESPENQKVSLQQLLAMDNFIIDVFSQIRSIIIIKNGYIIFEKYYRYHNSNDLFPLASVTKTFTSALVGIAINEGYIKSIDQKVYEFFPEFINELTNPIIRKITIENLLTMTSGQLWNDFDFGNPNVQRNLIAYVL